MPPPEPLSRRLGSQLSRGTHKLASHAVAAAQAAGASFVAGLKTCDERGGASVVASSLEIRVEDEPAAATAVLAIPSTGLASSNNGTTWGNISGFTVKLTLADSGPHAGCLVVRVKRDDQTSSDTVPVRCSWYRTLTVGPGLPNLDVPVSGVTGTVYVLSADDVFASLRVEVRSTSPLYPGTAFAEIGPFEVDAATRKNLGNFLAAGAATFPVQLKASDGELEQYTLHLTSSEVELRPSELNSYMPSHKCGYGGDSPNLKLDPHKSTGFTMTLLGGEHSHYLQAVSRTQRDLIAMTFRCFRGLTSVKHSTLLKSVTHECLDSGVLPRIDLLLLATGALSELRDAFAVAEKALREKSRVVKEKDALEADIAATISSFQSALSSATLGSVSKATPNELVERESQTLAADIARRAAHVASLEHKLSETQNELDSRTRELEMLRRDHRRLGDTIATLNQRPSTALQATQTADITIQTLRQELSTLTTLNKRLTMELQESRINQNSVPLETFTRAGKDMLDTTTGEEDYEEVSRLKQRLEEALAERDEINKSFLYIKEKYDELMRAKRDEAVTFTGSDFTLRIQALEKEKELSTRTLQETAKQLEETKQELYRLQTENSKLQNEKRRAVARVDAYREQLNEGSTIKLNHSETAEGILLQTASHLRETEELVRLSGRVEELEAEVEKLTEENAELQNTITELKGRLRRLAKESPGDVRGR